MMHILNLCCFCVEGVRIRRGGEVWVEESVLEFGITIDVSLDLALIPYRI
jgi:hypothetical protein